jgi:hypothetical protein
VGAVTRPAPLLVLTDNQPPSAGGLFAHQRLDHRSSSTSWRVRRMLGAVDWCRLAESLGAARISPATSAIRSGRRRASPTTPARR